jgi:hypothetical protein
MTIPTAAEPMSRRNVFLMPNVTSDAVVLNKKFGRYPSGNASFGPKNNFCRAAIFQ